MSLNFALSSQPVLGDWKVEVVYQVSHNLYSILPKLRSNIPPKAMGFFVCESALMLLHAERLLVIFTDGQCQMFIASCLLW